MKEPPRPGPVLDPPNLNTGEPWSEEDIRDLRWGVSHRETVDRTADFLCRRELEIRDKARELGHGELPRVLGRRKRPKS
jgi:hypothetical protein